MIKLIKNLILCLLGLNDVEYLLMSRVIGTNPATTFSLSNNEIIYSFQSTKKVQIKQVFQMTKRKVRIRTNKIHLWSTICQLKNHQIFYFA